MKYYTVETRAVSVDPNRNYTAMEIEGLYQDYLSNLDGTVEFYGTTEGALENALARYKEIDQGVIEHGPAAILVIAEVHAWEAPLEIGEGGIRDPAGFRGHPTDCDIEYLGVIKPENTVKHIQKMLKLYKQRKDGK